MHEIAPINSKLTPPPVESAEYYVAHPKGFSVHVACHVLKVEQKNKMAIIVSNKNKMSIMKSNKRTKWQ